MKNYSILYRFPGLLIILLMLISACSKMDGTYREFIKNGEKHYSERPDTIGIKPGHNRAQAWMAVSSRNISKIKIYWNARTDSVEVSVPENRSSDTLATVIESLDEGSYTFEFFTFDKQGNPSIGIDTTGQVFGTQYQQSLNSRLFAAAEKYSGQGRILWENVSHAEMVGTELQWTGLEGETHILRVKNEDTMTEIHPLPVGDEIQIRGLYLPHPQAIDTFYSDPKIIALMPREPIELDKSKFKEHALPGDAPISKYAKFGMAALWDDEITNTRFYGTESGSGSPHWFTFDLGVTAILSEMLYFQRAIDAEHLLFANANVQEFEIWGSTEPNPDGSWDESWVKLMDCVSQKPSGLPLGETNQADLDQATQGESFTFPDGVPAVRYLRIKVLGNWDPSTNDKSFMGELTFFGLID